MNVLAHIHHLIENTTLFHRRFRGDVGRRGSSLQRRIDGSLYVRLFLSSLSWNYILFGGEWSSEESKVEDRSENLTRSQSSVRTDPSLLTLAAPPPVFLHGSKNTTTTVEHPVQYEMAFSIMTFLRQTFFVGESSAVAKDRRLGRIGD